VFTLLIIGSPFWCLWSRKEATSHTYIPYVQGKNYCISRLLKKKPFYKMASHSPWHKNWAYTRFPCSFVKVYVNQMGCHISTRILEYIRHTRWKNQR
jgi:hypothetical protein